MTAGPRSSADPTARWPRAISATALRWVVGLAVLGWVVTRFEPAEIARRIAGLDPIWFAAGLGLSVVQVVASACRWRYTAARLDVDMPLQIGRAHV